MEAWKGTFLISHEEVEVSQSVRASTSTVSENEWFLRTRTPGKWRTRSGTIEGFNSGGCFLFAFLFVDEGEIFRSNSSDSDA